MCYGPNLGILSSLRCHSLCFQKLGSSWGHRQKNYRILWHDPDGLGWTRTNLDESGQTRTDLDGSRQTLMDPDRHERIRMGY